MLILTLCKSICFGYIFEKKTILKGTYFSFKKIDYLQGKRSSITTHVSSISMSYDKYSKNQPQKLYKKNII